MLRQLITRGFSAEVFDSDTITVTLSGGARTTFAPVDTEQVTDSIETFVGQTTGIEIIEAGIRQVEKQGGSLRPGRARRVKRLKA